jgi:tetratricopeptide (TPR) repeat protein
MQQDGANVGASYALCLLAALLLSGCNQEETVHKNPQDAIRDGWALITISDFDRAEAAFAHAEAASAPNSRELLLARYGLANAYQHRRPTPRYPEALKLYAEIAQQDKGGEIGAWSALAAARINHVSLYAVGREIPAGAQTGTGALPSAQELETLRAQYQNVISSFPGTLAAEESAVCIGSLLIEQIDEQHVKAGVAFLREWIALNPRSSYLYNAWRALAAGCDLLKDYKAQLAALLKAADARIDKDAERSAEFYRIAKVADTLANDPDVARRFYQRLIDEFPTNHRVFLCKRALERLKKTASNDLPLPPLIKGGKTEAR